MILILILIPLLILIPILILIPLLILMRTLIPILIQVLYPAAISLLLRVVRIIASVKSHVLLSGFFGTCGQAGGRGLCIIMDYR